MNCRQCRLIRLFHLILFYRVPRKENYNTLTNSYLYMKYNLSFRRKLIEIMSTSRFITQEPLLEDRFFIDLQIASDINRRSLKLNIYDDQWIPFLL